MFRSASSFIVRELTGSPCIIQAKSGDVVQKHELLQWEIINQLWPCWPGWLYLCNLFSRFKMWHILTSSKYTWSWKQMAKVEWDTQEETQQLESPHRLAHICCQIPSLFKSPGLSYDQQCYQWFTGILNCFHGHLPIQFISKFEFAIIGTSSPVAVLPYLQHQM